MPVRVILSLLALLLVPTAIAGEKASQMGACIDNQRIHSWRVAGDRQLDVAIGAGRWYRLDLALAAETAGLRSLSNVGFRADSSGQLCPRTGFVIADGRAIRIDSIQLLPAS